MSKIKLLSPDLIANIAAGEIIDRPASVIKELIENALDAQATAIRIILENSGLSKITVIDNGEGMNKDDLALACQAHSTSKLQVWTDLLQINSFGFRGEALASIANVSQLSIKSRISKENFGHQLTVNTSGQIEIQACGMPTGTNVTVSNLFHNLPARKKFLKSPATELRYIIEIITHLALAHPQVKFFLSHNQKIIFDLSQQSLELRIRSLLGTTLFQQLNKLTANPTTDYQLYGYLAKPQLLRKSAQKQYLFINKRPVRYLAINSIIKTSYQQLTGQKLYPPFIIFLDLAPSHLDINIHPQKHEVKLSNEEEMLMLIQQSINQTLSQTANKLAKQQQFYSYQQQSTFYKTQTPAPLMLKDKQAFLATAQMLKAVTDPWQTISKEPSDDILQINNLYLLSQTQQGLLIIDQHAAHERILYEQFLSAYKQVQSVNYKLATALILETSVAEAKLLQTQLQIFQQLGFEIEHLFDNTFQILTVPKIFKGRNILQIVNEVLDDLSENPLEKSLAKQNLIDRQTDQIIKYLACRSAVKAGDYLNAIEKKNLISKLFTCQQAYLCPHGRPAVIEISWHELEKMFKRSL